MGYRVEFKPSAVRALSCLPQKDRRRVASTIDSLAENPRPRGAEKIEGRKNLYRVPGDYRIIYEVQSKVLLVLVVKIGHPLASPWEKGS